MIGAIASRLREWLKMGLIIAVVVFVMLGLEYDDNCTRYRAPWCDFLDAVADLIPVPQ